MARVLAIAEIAVALGVGASVVAKRRASKT